MTKKILEILAGYRQIFRQKIPGHYLQFEKKQLFYVNQVTIIYEIMYSFSQFFSKIPITTIKSCNDFMKLPQANPPEAGKPAGSYLLFEFIPRFKQRGKSNLKIHWKEMTLMIKSCFDFIKNKYVFTGLAPPLHSGVYVSGHFNDLAAVAFLPPPRSPAKSMREPRSPPLLSR